MSSLQRSLRVLCPYPSQVSCLGPFQLVTRPFHMSPHHSTSHHTISIVIQHVTTPFHHTIPIVTTPFQLSPFHMSPHHSNCHHTIPIVTTPFVTPLIILHVTMPFCQLLWYPSKWHSLDVCQPLGHQDTCVHLCVHHPVADNGITLFNNLYEKRMSVTI